MASDSFTDLLSAAMSESGLMDLESSDGSTVDNVGGISRAANSRPVTLTAMSQQQQLMSVPAQLRTSNIVIRHPQSSAVMSLRPAASSAITQKGVPKLMIRPVPTGTSQSVPTRRPIVMQSADVVRQPVVQSNMTPTGQRPILPLVQTTLSSITVRPQTVSFVSTLAAGTPSPAVRPALRFMAIPRQLAAARLATTGEPGTLSLQIRPRMRLQTEASTIDSILQTSSSPTFVEAKVSSTTATLVPQVVFSSSSTAAVMSTASGTVTPPLASSAVVSASSVAKSRSVAETVASVNHAVLLAPIVSSLLSTADLTSVPSMYTESVCSKVSSHSDGCSAVICSAVQTDSRPVFCTGTVYTFTHSLDICASENDKYKSVSSDLPCGVNGALTYSNSLNETGAGCQTVNVIASTAHVAAADASAMSTSTAVDVDDLTLTAADSDEQQVTCMT